MLKIYEQMLKKIIDYNLINHLCFVLVEFRKLYLFGVANPIPELEIVTDVSCTDAFLFENAYFLMCSHLASTLKRRKTPMKTGFLKTVLETEKFILVTKLRRVHFVKERVAIFPTIKLKFVILHFSFFFA